MGETRLRYLFFLDSGCREREKTGLWGEDVFGVGLTWMAARFHGYFLSRITSILDDKAGNFERTESTELKKGSNAAGYSWGPRNPPVPKYAIPE
jgi:hypothetical protein